MSIPSPNSHFAPRVPAKLRRRGSRAQLATKFFTDVYAAWEEQGESVIARAAFHDPVAFMQMVARLMPQKIEVSTPTDGMSDERLSELLDLAERMAALSADQATIIQGEALAVQPAAPAPLAHKLTDEKPLDLNGAQAGGGGPVRDEPHAGENTPHTLSATAAETTTEQHNKLDTATEQAEEAIKLPHPVGRPTPLSAVEAARLNRAKLIHMEDIGHDRGESPIDPFALF